MLEKIFRPVASTRTKIQNAGIGLQVAETEAIDEAAEVGVGLIIDIIIIFRRIPMRTDILE